jgi:hypothetical protein
VPLCRRAELPFFCQLGDDKQMQPFQAARAGVTETGGWGRGWLLGWPSWIWVSGRTCCILSNRTRSRASLLLRGRESGGGIWYSPVSVRVEEEAAKAAQARLALPPPGSMSICHASSSRSPSLSCSLSFEAAVVFRDVAPTLNRAVRGAVPPRVRARWLHAYGCRPRSAHSLAVHQTVRLADLHLRAVPTVLDRPVRDAEQPHRSVTRTAQSSCE